MLWDLRLISFQQRFMSPDWLEPPPLSRRHSVPSSWPSPSTVDWHGTQWHPGHEGRPAAAAHTHTYTHTTTQRPRVTAANTTTVFSRHTRCLPPSPPAVLSFCTPPVFAPVPPHIFPVVYVSLTFISLFTQVFLSLSVAACAALVFWVFFLFFLASASLVTSSCDVRACLLFWICPLGFGFVCLFCC